IAKYCYQLAVSFNTFYEHVKVLTADSESTVNARLCLVYSFKETLAKALQLLGIDAPERMYKLVSTKAVIPVIFAAIGLVFTVVGMFTVSQGMVWTGVGFWVASVVSGRILKRKPKTGEETKV